MNIKSSSCVYPSYSSIQQGIQEKHLQKYESKINCLKSHLRNLKANHHFESDHEKIQTSILQLSNQNPLHQTQEKDTIMMIDSKKNSGLSNFNGESLNYYIEDDGEQESNYETYLKFKKKALERDLEEEKLSRTEVNSFERRRQKEEEELFFRQLYVKEPSGWMKGKGGGARRTNTKAKSGFSLKETKQNAGNFLKKIGNGHLKGREESGKVRGGREGGGIEAEIETYQKNQKYLTENYPQILKKLEGTNVVKWRVLNSKVERKE